MPDRPEVLILGAGAAGLAAAAKLAEAKVSFLLLEAKARLGGRVFTLHPKGASFPVELGAAAPEGLAALLEGLPEGSFLREAVVRELAWTRGEVRLEAVVKRKRTLFDAPRAVVALPLGVLKAKPGLPGAVRFKPALASKAPALEHLRMGAALRLELVFKPQAWKALRLKDEVLDSLKQRESSWTRAPAERPALSVRLEGTEARAQGAAGAKAAFAWVLAELSRGTGLAEKRLEQALASWHWHDWQADPFARGAYSEAGEQGLWAVRELARPLEGTLYFAGEATDGGEPRGNLAGALASGRRAADEVLRDRKLA